MENQKKGFIYKVLGFLNRFAHWFDLIIYYFLCNWLFKTQFSSSGFGFLIFAPLVIQIYLCFKYEYKVFKSKNACTDILLNGRVMGFSGLQGQGKSSFATFLSSNKYFDKVYSNTPIKLRGKYTCMVEQDILNLDTQIDDKSLIILDEATLFYHNRKSDNKTKLADELYAQEIFTQCVRHFTDGNIFYISTDLSRLPAVIRENVGLVNFMLGQGNKTISFLTGFVACSLANLLGYEMRNGLRYWDFQQFVKIPDSQYTFDLSRQTKDEDLSNFANLVRVYTFDNPNLFDYNNRFLAGVYKELPKHIDKHWSSLEFDRKLLSDIGYGEIVSFFDKKKFKRKRKGDGEYFPITDPKKNDD